MKAAQKKLSLQARAIQWLSMREHSRVELKRKLMQQQRKEARQLAAARLAASDGQPEPCDLDDGQVTWDSEIEAVLDALEAKGFLSNDRFAASRIRTRAPKLGIQRIKAELQQHGLQLSPDQSQHLYDSEHSRAKAVWQRKFGSEIARTPEERAKQQRFLAARGFSPDVIRKVTAGI